MEDPLNRASWVYLTMGPPAAIQGDSILSPPLQLFREAAIVNKTKQIKTPTHFMCAKSTKPSPFNDCALSLSVLGRKGVEELISKSRHNRREILER